MAKNKKKSKDKTPVKKVEEENNTVPDDNEDNITQDLQELKVEDAVEEEEKTQVSEDTKQDVQEEKKESVEAEKPDTIITADKVESPASPVLQTKVEDSPTTESDKKSEDPVKEETKAQPAEKAPEAESKPAPAPSKKRLTLQERLALAAKSGKSKRSTSGTPATNKSKSEATTPEPSSIVVDHPVRPSIDSVQSPISNSPVEPTTRDTSIDITRPEAPKLFPENYKELPQEELWNIIAQVETKYSNIEFKNKSLVEEKSSLQEKIKNLNSSLQTASQKSSSHSDQLVKEKDEKIAQLIKEGEELSLKELKYNNTIKKLKAKEADNDSEIKELSRKVQTLEFEKRELKETLKKAQESEKQSILNGKSLKIQLNIEKDSLKEEVSRNEALSTKLEELNEAHVQERTSYIKEINALKRQVEKENQKFLVSKEEYSREVTRLENKIEQLRFQTENQQAKTTQNDDGYAKLSRQHDILQAQYTSATENWQSIEASLGAKINDLETQIHDLSNSLKDSESKVDVLSKDLSEKVQQINNLQRDVKSLTFLKGQLEFKVQTLEKSLQESEELLDEKELTFKQQKAQLEIKVQQLERSQRDIQPQQISVSTEYSNPYTNSPLFSRNASASSIKKQWDSREVSFGESSTTPIQSRKTSMFLPSNDSFTEGPEGPDDSYSDFGENDTVNSPVSQFNNGSRADNGSSSAIGGGSVQLLSKLSGQVRRLETELLTLKEESAKLNEDKKTANEEIVRLMKDNEEVENYKSEIIELKEQIEHYKTRSEKTLEILGEKSELVEELRNDVQDLKDLCKLQVQQLVEFQTNK